MNKKLLLSITYLMLIGCSSLYAQQTALKSNILYLGTTTPNAGVELGLGNHFTLEVWGAYNAWKFPNKMKLNLYLAQPEFRFWPCQKFEGHFFGAHAHYGHFNIGQIPFISGLKDYVLRGDLYGAGLSYGYHWALGERWGMEASIGVGYAHMAYTKFHCDECAEPVGYFTREYFGPTRAAFSIIYFIR